MASKVYKDGPPSKIGIVFGADGAMVEVTADDPLPVSVASLAVTAGALTIADGADVTLGAKADTPSTAVEDATARTGISLWKGIKNYLRLLNGQLPTLLGSQLKAASLSVTLASDTGNTPVSDAGPSWTSAHGVAAAPFTSADQSAAVAAVTDAPTGGQKLVISDIIVSVDTAMAVTFTCQTSGAVIVGPIYMPANSCVQLTPRSKAWKLATADKKLMVRSSVAGNIMVDAHYYSEA